MVFLKYSNISYNKGLENKTVDEGCKWTNKQGIVYPQRQKQQCYQEKNPLPAKYILRILTPRSLFLFIYFPTYSY